MRRWPWALLVLSTVLGCKRQPPEEQGTASTASAAEVTTQWVELRARTPGRTTEEALLFVEQPFEAQLLELRGLQHLAAEVRAGRVWMRLQLGMDRDEVEALLPEILGRVSVVADDQARPTATLAPADDSVTLRWAVTAEQGDPSVARAVHRDLLRAVSSHPGVRRIQDCSEIERVGIHLHLERASIFGLGLGELATALDDAVRKLDEARTGLVPKTPRISIEELQQLVVTEVGGRPLHLRDLAELGLETAPQGCVAVSRGQRAPAGLVTVDATSREEIEALIDGTLASARERGTALHRFDPDALAIEVWLPPLEPEAALQQLHGLLPAELRDEALVIHGVETEPCAGSSRHATIVLPGQREPSASLRAALAAPGVEQVLLPDDRVERVLLASGGFESELLAGAGALVAKAGRAEGVGSVAAFGHTQAPELPIELDREAIDAAGLAFDTVGMVLAATRGGYPLLEVATPDEIREVRLFIELDDPEELARLPMAVRGEEPPVTLGALALIGRRPQPSTQCRHDGRTVVALQLKLEPGADPAAARAAIDAIPLPEGHAWVWPDTAPLLPTGAAGP